MVEVDGVEFAEPPDDPHADTNQWEWVDYGSYELPVKRGPYGVKCSVTGCRRSFDSMKGWKHHVAMLHDVYRTVDLTCPECGDTFEVEPSDASKRKYCSSECRGIGQREQIEKTCEQCGDGFTIKPSQADGRRFCSRECYDEFKRVPRVTLVCEECGDEFEVIETEADGRKFCSNTCGAKASSLTTEFYND